MKDRRIFARFDVGVPGRLLSQDDKEKMTKVCDISAKGVGVVSDEKVDYNTLVELWIELPDKRDSFYIRGKVSWVKEVTPEKYRIGINLDKADFMGLAYILRNTGGLRGI